VRDAGMLLQLTSALRPDQTGYINASLVHSSVHIDTAASVHPSIP